MTDRVEGEPAGEGLGRGEVGGGVMEMGGMEISTIGVLMWICHTEIGVSIVLPASHQFTYQTTCIKINYHSYPHRITSSPPNQPPFPLPKPLTFHTRSSTLTPPTSCTPSPSTDSSSPTPPPSSPALPA